MKFMHDLPVRKVPGIGRVGERVLEAMGVRVGSNMAMHPNCPKAKFTLDMWRHSKHSSRPLAYAEEIRCYFPLRSAPRHFGNQN